MDMPMKGILGIAIVATIVLAGCGQSEETASSSSSAGELALSTQLARSSSPEATSELLTDHIREEQRLVLESIPPEAPPPSIDEQRAIDLALAELQSIGYSGPPIVVEHGMAIVMDGQPRQSAWLVAVSANGETRPGGPVCADDENCTRPTLVADVAGTLISDQTGEVLRSFTSGHVADPSGGPLT